MPRAIWTLGLVSLFMDISSELIHALLPVFLVTTLGVSVLTVGIIEGFAEATASITKIFSGAISDWISKGIRGAPRDALVADIAPPALRGAAFGLRQALDTVGGLLGPLLAILLMLLFADDIRTVLWFAVLPAFLAFALLAFGVSEPARRDTAARAPFPISRTELGKLGRAYWWVVVVGTIFNLARFSEAFLILRAQEFGLSIAWVPVVMVVMSAAYAASAYPAGCLSDRVDRRRVLIVGLALLIAADLLLAGEVGLWGMMAGVALWGLHMGFTQGLLATLVADAAPAALRGTAFGMFNLVCGLAMLVASALAGLLWSELGSAATFLAGALFAAVALAGLLLTRRKPPVASEA